MAHAPLFTAQAGVVFFQNLPVPDWTVAQVKRAIRDEGLEVDPNTRAFDVWRETYEQLIRARFEANNQRRLSA